MKKKINIILTIFVVVLLIISLGVNFKNNYKVIHISAPCCNYFIGDDVTPEIFCNTKGQGTELEGKYLFSKVDKDGGLILVMSNQVIEEWKNTFFEIQVLQVALGPSRDIGVKVDYSNDFFGILKDAADCGFEISDDYTEVICSADDNVTYFFFIVSACLSMQTFEGRNYTERKVEFIRLDEKGEIIDRSVISDGINGLSMETN